MDSFKEFLGKDFDDCIGQALQYYDCPRENLEVEIVQDAKSGIFGIVGARKAKIRARRARLSETVANLLGFEEQAQTHDCRSQKNCMPPLEKTAKREMAQAAQQQEDFPGQDVAQAKAQYARQQVKTLREKAAKMDQTRPRRDKTEPQDVGQAQKQPRKKTTQQEKPARLASMPPESDSALAQASQTPEMLEATHVRLPAKIAPEQPRRKGAGEAEAKKRQARSAQPEPKACQERMYLEAEDIEGSAWPIRPIEELDQALLAQKALEIVGALLTPIAGKETAMRMDADRGCVRVHVDWEGDAGLLIGREGQTLAAVQYLASRMLSRIMTASLRVQVDIGDYRARQDDKLRELAKTLADRARQAGRPFSTRPLPSYHRRVIHLFLQDCEDIQTRSIGEGPQKRVLIAPRRSCPQ